jgi:glycosyltransferase involved in cell wall biosynthesis
MSGDPVSGIRPRTIAYVINHAAFFISHRLPLALEARRRGYRIVLITGQAGSDSMEPVAERALAEHGIEHVRLAFTSSGTNPLVELRGLLQLVSQLRRLKPDLVHCASPKANLYAGIAARLARIPAMVFAISGMGFAFTSAARQSAGRAGLAVLFRRLAAFSFRHPHKRIIVQNHDDLELMLAAKFAKPSEIVLIPGSGVDLDMYAAADPASKQNVVLFPARVLIDKGASEFIATARALRAFEPKWRFVIAGTADYRNPSSVPRAQLEELQANGVIEWLGHVADMPRLFNEVAIVCLPSYREGMPKALLEAAAAGCAVVTTDVPGCREAILPGVTGDLVPPRDVAALTAALTALMADRNRRESYGRAGRKLAATRFGVVSVVDRVMNLYGELLINGPRE